MVVAILFLAAAILLTGGIGGTARSEVPEAGSMVVLIIEQESVSTNSMTDCPDEPAFVDERAGQS